jgi:arsenate reductase
MRRIYYLSTCDTCAKIIAEVKPPKDMELIDIKATNIDGDTLDWLKGKVGSYEEMFSKRALKYRSMGLNEMKLTENDYRKYWKNIPSSVVRSLFMTIRFSSGIRLKR